jgi:hypothetical protein
LGAPVFSWRHFLRLTLTMTSWHWHLTSMSISWLDVNVIVILWMTSMSLSFCEWPQCHCQCHCQWHWHWYRVFHKKLDTFLFRVFSASRKDFSMIFFSTYSSLPLVSFSDVFSKKFRILHTWNLRFLTKVIDKFLKKLLF